MNNFNSDNERKTTLPTEIRDQINQLVALLLPLHTREEEHADQQFTSIN